MEGKPENKRSLKNRIDWAQPFCDSFVLRAEADPYGQLADFGIEFNSSSDDVKRCEMEVLKCATLNTARDQACSQLRLPEKRLIVDFLYFHPEPGAFDPNEPEAPRPNIDATIGYGEAAEHEDLLWRLLLESSEPARDELPPLPFPQPLADDKL